MDNTAKTPLVVSLPPTLYTDRHGQKWAVSGGCWIEVPASMTYDRLSEVMVVRWAHECQQNAPGLPTRRFWAVSGSKGTPYTVSEHKGAWACSCAGFGWRRKCRHVAEIKLNNS